MALSQPTPHHLALEAAFPPPGGATIPPRQGRKGGRKQGQTASQSPSQGSWPSRSGSSTLPQHQGWGTLTQGHSQTEPQKDPDRGGPGGGQGCFWRAPRGAAREKRQSIPAKEAGRGPLGLAQLPQRLHPALWSLALGPAPSPLGAALPWAVQPSGLPQTLLTAKRGQQTSGVMHHPSDGRLIRGRTPGSAPPALPSAEAAQQSRDTHSSPGAVAQGATGHHGGGRAGEGRPGSGHLSR